MVALRAKNPQAEAERAWNYLNAAMDAMTIDGDKYGYFCMVPSEECFDLRYKVRFVEPKGEVPHATGCACPARKFRPCEACKHMEIVDVYYQMIYNFSVLPIYDTPDPERTPPTMIQNIDGLTQEQILRACPSVFAESAHDSRSERYMYIPTITILDALHDAGFAPTTVMQSKSRDLTRQDFTKHLIRLRKFDDLGYEKPDVHEVVLVNSHDGTSAYNLYSGIFRLVCTNGMIVGDIGSTMKVYHKGNVVDQVVESTLTIVEESEQVMEDIEVMKQIELSRPEQLLLAEMSMKARFDVDEEVPYQPSDFLRPHRREDVGNDLYRTFNVIQENAIKGGVSRRDSKGQRHTTREIKGIDQNVRTNRLLWELTQRMAELKQQ